MVDALDRGVRPGAAVVPVLVIAGPVGVGKTTTAAAVSDLLAEQNSRHAVIDHPQIGILRAVRRAPHVERAPLPEWPEPEAAHARCAPRAARADLSRCLATSTRHRPVPSGERSRVLRRDRRLSAHTRAGPWRPRARRARPARMAARSTRSCRRPATTCGDLWVTWAAMLFRQFVDDDLGCGSYLVGDREAGEAVVVDPAVRDRAVPRRGRRRGRPDRARARDAHARRPPLRARPLRARARRAGLDPPARASRSTRSTRSPTGRRDPRRRGRDPRRAHARAPARALRVRRRRRARADRRLAVRRRRGAARPRDRGARRRRRPLPLAAPARRAARRRSSSTPATSRARSAGRT